MSFNGEMALILHYFAEFGIFRGAAISVDNVRLLPSSKRVQKGLCYAQGVNIL